MLGMTVWHYLYLSVFIFVVQVLEFNVLGMTVWHYLYLSVFVFVGKMSGVLRAGHDCLTLLVFVCQVARVKRTGHDFLALFVFVSICICLPGVGGLRCWA